MADEKLARHYIAMGGLFVAVGLDSNLLARHSSALAASFRQVAPAARSS
jgi:4-hydroxy-2-oxoheptanedioate aldolase